MGFSNGDRVEISIRGTWLDQAWFNVWQYRVGAAVALVTAEQLGEAWWNHVKTTYRAIAPDTVTTCFQSVLVKSLESPTGDYGEYSIPFAEADGTRSPSGIGDPLPSYTGIGVRLSVGTRATRPGQKRLTFLYEADQSANVLAAGITAAAVALMDVMIVEMVLGSPAATMTLQPVVVRKDVAGMATVDQDITSYAINPYISSQISRKRGHGI